MVRRCLHLLAQIHMVVVAFKGVQTSISTIDVFEMICVVVLTFGKAGCYEREISFDFGLLQISGVCKML